MAPKIVVIGSVAWDEVVELDRPLQSGGHNQGRMRGRRIGGGAANTALALIRGGNEVVVRSAIGGDSQGGELLTALSREGIDVCWIDDSASATTRSLLLLDPTGGRTIVNLSRASLPVTAPLGEQNTACVYLRSTDTAFASVLRECLDQGLVIAHIPPLAAGSRPAHILVGSTDDLEAGFLEDPWRSARAVAGEKLRWVVVTNGAEGASAYSGEQVLRLPAPRVRVVDTTGAGDVFAAGLIHALVRDEPMERALRCAVEWGAASVQYHGTIPPIGFPDIRTSADWQDV